jgi:hypothetical protein
MNNQSIVVVAAKYEFNLCHVIFSISTLISVINCMHTHNMIHINIHVWYQLDL